MARFLGALLLCLAVAVFAVQNDQAVRLVYLGMRAPAVHLAFLILAALILGAAVTVLLGGLQVLRLRRRVADLERDLAVAREELGSARGGSALKAALATVGADEAPPVDDAPVPAPDAHPTDDDGPGQDGAPERPPAAGDPS